MDNQQLKDVITCPYCGREYLPSEIFIGQYVFNKPTNIRRNKNRKIIDYNGTSVDADEKYICDSCNLKFYVHIDFKFTTKKDTKYSLFNEEYITKL